MTACAACGYDADAPVSLSFSFFVPMDSKSDNGRGVNSGATRWAYAKNRKAWSWHIRAAIIALPGSQTGKATKRRRLTITRFYGGPQKARDTDNLVTSFKPAVDALVEHGLLMHDGPAGVESHYKQQRTAKGEPSGVRLLIEELA